MSKYQEEAIAQQLYDMSQKDVEGMHASYAYTKAHEKEYRNKGVEELICDPYFLGLKDHIFPQHLDDIIELWEERKKRPINLALFEQSIGAGKTMIASILVWLQWYEVATIYNPQEHFNLAPGSTIAMMTMSRTELQAKRVIFSDVFKRFQSPFNKDYFPPNPRYQKEIQIAQNNTVIYAGTSSELCLSVDEEILVDHDKSIKLSELIGQGEIDILGFDTNKEEFVITEARDVVDAGEKEVYEVEFENGQKIQCTEDHKFLTYKLKRGKKRNGKRLDSRLVFEYKNLKDIDDSDEIVTQSDFVRCKLCGKLLTQITQSHLDRYHNGIGSIEVSELIKLRIANKARSREYRRGYKRETWICEKISKALTGRKFSDKHIENIKKSWTEDRRKKAGDRQRTRPMKMTKDELSQWRSKTMTGWGNPMFGKPPRHGKKEKYKEIWFRSSWEVRVAKFLDLNEIIWEYEPETFLVSERLSYTPDFYLLEFGVYLEVKGYFRNERALEKFNLFAKDHIIMLIRKQQMKDLNCIIRFVNEDNIKEITG